MMASGVFRDVLAIWYLQDIGCLVSGSFIQ